MFRGAKLISALFSFAEYFKKHPPKHSDILAAFDGEELGLQRSKYFTNYPVFPLEYIKVNLNMDMISISDKNELFVAGTSFYKSLKNLVENYNYSEKIKVLLGHDGYDRLDNWTYSSDHADFHKKEIPFLYFGVEAVNVIIGIFQKIDNLVFKNTLLTVLTLNEWFCWF